MRSIYEGVRIVFLILIGIGAMGQSVQAQPPYTFNILQPVFPGGVHSASSPIGFDIEIDWSNSGGNPIVSIGMEVQVFHQGQWRGLKGEMLENNFSANPMTMKSRANGSYWTNGPLVLPSQTARFVIKGTPAIAGTPPPVEYVPFLLTP